MYYILDGRGGHKETDSKLTGVWWAKELQYAHFGISILILSLYSVVGGGKVCERPVLKRLETRANMTSIFRKNERFTASNIKNQR